jgi:hypothetical protein
MTTNENTAQEPKDHECSFKGCQEMMKMMMSRCMEGKGEKKDFEQMCGNMSAMCREMMKKMDDQNKGKGE